MIKVQINGVEREFETQEAADAAQKAAATNAANLEAARLLAAAGVGGSKYKQNAQALAFTRNVLADVLADATDDDGNKLKSKDVTNAVIAKHVLGLSEADFIARAKAAYKLVVEPINSLTTSEAIPMKGGKLPADVASRAITMIRPESAAAAKSAALTDILSVC